MKKKIFLGALVVIVIGIAYAVFQYNKPHKDIAGASSELVLTAEELAGRFDKNMEQASSELMGKVVEIKGTITHLEHSETQSLIILNDRIKCGLAQVNTNLTRDQIIKIKGVYSGFDEMFNEISFSKCYVVTP